MITWLVLQSTPIRVFYRDPEALRYIDSGTAAHALLVSVEPLRASVDGENANLSVTLKAGADRLMRIPPIGAVATAWSLKDGIVTDEFTGTVQKSSVTRGGVTLSLEQ